MEKANISIYSKSDLHYIDLIGEFVKASRLAQNKTQQQLSDDAGINRTTLVQLEKGNSVNLLSLIQVLRALKKLHVFREMEVKPQLSPMQLAEIEQKYRQRARPVKSTRQKPQSDW